MRGNGFQLAVCCCGRGDDYPVCVQNLAFLALEEIKTHRNTHFFKKKKMDWTPWNVYLFQLFIKQCNFCYLGYLYIQIIENKSVHGCKLMAPCVALCTRTNFSNVSWPRIIILGFKTSHPKTNSSKLLETSHPIFP